MTSGVSVCVYIVTLNKHLSKQDYKSCHYCNSGVWNPRACDSEKPRQRADICIFRLRRAMWANACVTLTWWPMRWRRAEFPAGRADSLHSSSGAGASLHRSCHSSGTCRRRARRQASERQTAGRPPHTPGSRSRSRWPGVGGGGNGKGNRVKIKDRKICGRQKRKKEANVTRDCETTRGRDGGSLREKRDVVATTLRRENNSRLIATHGRKERRHKENEMSNRSKNIWWNLTTGNCCYLFITEWWINNKHAASLLKTHFPLLLQS